MKNSFLVLVLLSFFQILAGPTEIFEQFLRTNPSVDSLAQKLDEIKNSSAHAVALKKAMAKYGAQAKGEWGIVLKAPSGQAVFALKNSRSTMQKPTIITETRIVKDAEAEEKLAAERLKNQQLAAQLAVAHTTREELQQQLEQERSRQNSRENTPSNTPPGTPRRLSNADLPAAPQVPGNQISMAPGTPLAPGLLKLGGQAGGISPIAQKEKPERFDKENMTPEDKQISDKEVVALISMLARIEGQLDGKKINSFDLKIYENLLELDQNNTFNNRIALKVQLPALKDLFKKYSPQNIDDFKEYYHEENVTFNVGDAGNVAVQIFKESTEKYKEFLKELTNTFAELLFDKELLKILDKGYFETIALSHLSAQREKPETIPADTDKPEGYSRSNKQKKSDRALLGTLLRYLMDIKTTKNQQKTVLDINGEQQNKKAKDLADALNWLRINPDFIAFKNMLWTDGKSQEKQGGSLVSQKTPLLILLHDQIVKPLQIRAELLNHVWLQGNSLEEFFRHVQPQENILEIMALLFTKKEDKQVGGVAALKPEKQEASAEIVQLITLVMQARKEVREDTSKNFESLLRTKLEENKGVLEKIHSANYAILIKTLLSLYRTAGQIDRALSSLLGKNSALLTDPTLIKKIAQSHGMSQPADKAFISEGSIAASMGETSLVVADLKEFISSMNKDKNDISRSMDIFSRFVPVFGNKKFKAPAIGQITHILLDSLDDKAGSAARGVDLVKLVINSPETKQLYTAKGTAAAQEIVTLLKKYLIESHFVEADNRELEPFIQELHSKLAFVLPEAYKRSLIAQKNRVMERHEKA